MSRGSNPTTISTINTAPSAFAQEFLRPGLESAQRDILERPQRFFPGTTVAPFSPETETALAARTGRALAGSPLDIAGRGQIEQTLAGDFLQGGNPAYDALVNRSLRPVTEQFENVVLPRIRGSFSQAGRGGSNIATQRAIDAASQGYLDTVGDVSAQLAAPTYEAERARQMSAAQLAPGFAADDYADIAQLADVGARREDLLRRQLEEQALRFQFGQREPAARASGFLGAIQGQGLGTRETDVRPEERPNALLGALGGAGFAASTIPRITPTGIGIGGLLGGLGTFIG